MGKSLPVYAAASGDRHSVELAFSQEEDGLPVDLTGATVYVTAKVSEDDEDADAVVLTTIGPGEHVDAAAGQTAFLLDLSAVEGPARFIAEAVLQDSLGERTNIGRWVIEVREGLRTLPA